MTGDTDTTADDAPIESSETRAVMAQFADALTQKVCESIRSMPAITHAQVGILECTVAHQLVTGLRGCYGEQRDDDDRGSYQ